MCGCHPIGCTTIEPSSRVDLTCLTDPADHPGTSDPPDTADTGDVTDTVDRTGSADHPENGRPMCGVTGRTRGETGAQL